MQDQRRRGVSFRRQMAAMTVFVVVGFTALGVYAWREFADAELGFNGYLAFALGAFFTALVGAGLLALLYFSHRFGYDDDVGTPNRRRGLAKRGERPDPAT